MIPIRNAESLVKKVLETFPATRSDDRELILKVWEAQGLLLSPEQKQVFLRCFSTETIRRTRQKIQEEGQYLPTDSVATQRRKLEQETRDFFREKNKPPPKHYEFDQERQLYLIV